MKDNYGNAYQRRVSRQLQHCVSKYWTAPILWEAPAGRQAADGDLLFYIYQTNEEEVKGASNPSKTESSRNDKILWSTQIVLKADIYTFAKVRTDFFRSVWKKDVIPEDRCKGFVIKCPRKETNESEKTVKGNGLYSRFQARSSVMFYREESLETCPRLREEHAGRVSQRKWLSWPTRPYLPYAIYWAAESAWNGIPSAHELHQTSRRLSTARVQGELVEDTI